MIEYAPASALDEIPAWPAGLPRVLRPLARVRYADDGDWRAIRDMREIERANLRARRHGAVKCGFPISGMFSECFFRTVADGSAVVSTASETTLLPANVQPILPANEFLQPGTSFRFWARGIFSNTSTPTMTWQLRLGTGQGTATLSGTSIGVSSAITTTTGVSNVFWQMVYDMESRTDSASGSGNMTVSGGGFILSPAGFASPFIYSLIQSAGSATWTFTTQGDAQLYVNFSLTWGTSSASNTCTLKSFKAYREN
ncbi:MAG: hypothetical protein KGL39_10820 [Patescibacteria group bacterium]|nr:hypothetical protein [Patescibacteria group bacterium]